jgi:hypothetical protein
MVLATLPTLSAFLVLAASAAPRDATPLVEVKVTQKHLQPLCLDGAPVKRGERRFWLDLREHSLAFTMQNQPRLGAPDAEVAPGVAVIGFTPEAGHRYEVEIRAAESSYGRRVWNRGEWKPVVRDRTVDRVVSTQPEWRESACQPDDGARQSQREAP